MSISDKIAAATGLNYILNRQQAKQGGAIKELASGEKQSATAKLMAVPFDTEEKTSAIVLNDIGLAGSVISSARQALASVSDTLVKALSVATEALSAPPEERKALANQFNSLLGQTEGFIEHADVNGLNLVSSRSRPMTVNTTSLGGELTVANAPSSAAALGIAVIDKASWLEVQSIQMSVNELQNAIISLSTTQSRLAQAQYTLGIAAELNQTMSLTDNRARAAIAEAAIAESAQSEWQAEAKRTVAEEASREANLRQAYARQMLKG